MKNGDAVTAFIIDVKNRIDYLTVLDYYGQVLPSAVDEEIGELIGRFMSLDAEARERFQRALSRQERALFGIYGHRAATLAAREEAKDAARSWLLRGLVGAAIANYTIPEKRRVEVALAVYHHVARRLDLNPIELFEDAAVYAGDAIAPALLAFGRRGDVSLNNFGWRELRTPDGVKYKFEWA